MNASQLIKDLIKNAKANMKQCKRDDKDFNYWLGYRDALVDISDEIKAEKK